MTHSGSPRNGAAPAIAATPVLRQVRRTSLPADGDAHHDPEHDDRAKDQAPTGSGCRTGGVRGGADLGLVLGSRRGLGVNDLQFDLLDLRVSRQHTMKHAYRDGITEVTLP